MKNYLLTLILYAASFATNAATAPPSTWIFNLTQQQVVGGESNDIQRPIASLTKIMTAMVLLNSGPDFSESLLLDRHTSTSLPLKYYSRLELVNAMLVKSDNAAAETLALNYPGGRTQFIIDMNKEANLLGMTHTNFDDPTGLSQYNISTPSEVGKMLAAADKNELIKHISTQKQIQIPSYKKKVLQLSNTNIGTLNKFSDIVVSKTGYTIPAGFCVGMVVQRLDQQYIIVVMGEKNKMQRAATIDKIMQQLQTLKVGF